MKQSDKDRRSDEIDEAGKETFPTSDPPAWTLGTNQEALDSETETVHDLPHILAHEHHIIRKVLDIVVKLIQAVEDNERINMSMFKRLILLSEKFIEQGHQKKEELLYPALQQGEDHPSQYLINDLLHEHQHGDQLLTDLVKAIDLFEQDKVKAKQAFLILLNELRDLQHNHVNKEDEYIIPAINKVVSKKQQNNLLTQFDKIAKDIGVNTGDELLQMAKEMSNKYLH